MKDEDCQRWLGYLHELQRFNEATPSIVALPNPLELRGAPTIVLRREVLVRTRMQMMLLEMALSELTGIPTGEMTPGVLAEYMAKLHYERKKAKEKDAEQERAEAQGSPGDRPGSGGGDAGRQGDGG